MPACSVGCEAGPYGSGISSSGLPTLFLRGDMNDWNSDLKFAEAAPGKFTVSTRLAPGVYAFKVATQNWAVVDLGAPRLNQRELRLDQSLPAVVGSIEPFQFTVSEAGLYQFALEPQLHGRFSLTVTQSPEITVPKGRALLER